MEIKTTKEIINNELGVILNSVDYDVNNTLFEINKYKKWVNVDDVKNFLIEWEEHHTLSRNLVSTFEQLNGDVE